MTRPGHIVAILLFSQASYASPLLGWLGSQTRVVLGTEASALERDAAFRLGRALNPTDPSAPLLTHEGVGAHPDLAASHHLIVVGTENSNRVLCDQPSLWWRTADRADSAAFPVRGLYLFGAGDLEGRSTGIVEPRRNPYSAMAHDATEPGPDTPLTWMITLSGRFPEGVAAAVGAFLDGRMLSGAVPDSRARAARSHGPFEMEPRLLASMPPLWALPDPVDGWVAVGWHQSDGLLIGALTARLGTAPRNLWRIVFRNPASPRNLTANLHRRNTVNEVLLCRMNSEQEATDAIQALLGDLGEVRQMPGGRVKMLVVDGVQDSVYGTAVGAYWALESFDGAVGRRAVEAILGEARN